MKKITENTILKQGEKEFSAVQFADNICWYSADQATPIAQSEPILEEVAVVRLKDSTTQSIMEGEIPFNLSVYTQSDIARAIVLARKGIIGRSDETFYGSIDNLLDVSYILNQINQIQSITVDENFNILSYE